MVNKWTAKRITNLLRRLSGNSERRYVIAGDTDSLYINIDDIVEKMYPNGYKNTQDVVNRIDELCKAIIEPALEQYCVELFEYMNCVQNKMKWEREIIAESMIHVAKKRYCAKVWDNEGVRYTDTPKYKIMGLESKKSSTPAWSRKMLDSCYKLCLDKDETKLHIYYKDLQNQFMKMTPEEVAIPTGVNNIEKYATGDNALYCKGTPYNVKAAIVHNALVDMYKLNHIDPITSGSKIRILPLKKQNPTHRSAVGFIGKFPKEFELNKYIDYETIFNKSFVTPLDSFLEHIKWTKEETFDLDNFF